MLVFACGLMLALAVYWNIELGPVGERIDLNKGKEVTETPQIRDDLVETPDTVSYTHLDVYKRQSLDSGP